MTNQTYSLKSLSDLDIKIIDGDRGAEYPKSNEILKNGYCVFLNAKNISSEGFVFSDIKFITFEKHTKLLKGIVKNNDIVLTTRGTVGNLALFVDKLSYDAVRINSSMVIIRNENPNIITDFLYKVLNSDFVKNQIKKISYGSAQNQITVKDIKNIMLPIPTLDKQKEFLELIYLWDNAVNQYKKLIEYLNKYKRMTLQHLTESNVDNNKIIFKQKLLEEVCIVNIGTKFEGNFKYKVKAEIPFIKINDLNIPGNEKYIIKTKLSLNRKDIKKINGKLFYKNSIILPKVGASALLNKRGILSRESVIDNNLLCLTANEKECNSEYLYQILLTLDLSKISQESAIPLINKRELSNIRIFIPELDVQNKIANILKKYDELIENKIKIYKLLIKQRLLISNKFFL
ncbi:restriction endonuclease subunit S [Fluviispira sanaruensis]|uniref:Restriction endonuclease subunit S n=1 Tax=Fluviispira sanaruensis TaxID=2493639 RepID=A0A4P2VJW7_FLUSA|nr:restriction endonuclease subunit S [Fluviispira sanaruensis]BBH52184.1 restriction endonuclease subunit S [Fluviispira sanaruensis]